MATLSLYFFNLLPLPFLDGAQFLEGLLDLTLNSTEQLSTGNFSLEALERGNHPDSGRRPRRATNGISKVIRTGTIGLLGTCMTLTFVNVIISWRLRSLWVGLQWVLAVTVCSAALRSNRVAICYVEPRSIMDSWNRETGEGNSLRSSAWRGQRCGICSLTATFAVPVSVGSVESLIIICVESVHCA